MADRGGPDGIGGTAFLRDGRMVCIGPNRAARFSDLPALRWPAEWIARHAHHHHRFDAEPVGPGAEMEASRGCPYHCSFCAKIDFRDDYRRRDLAVLLDELDALIAQGVRYVYFIDEIFLPQRPLLEALAERDIQFGVQTRIDLWKPEMIELLGRAGCVSIEAGVESLTEEGRDWLTKKCRMSTDELSDRLILARRHVPFVQANLIATAGDDPAMIADWRETLRAQGVWANDPVPLYPYPSSPDYRQALGRAGCAGLGAGARALSRAVRADERDPGAGAIASAGARGRMPAGVTGRAPRRVLLSTDAVGGVWTYALDLARGLSERGTDVVLAVLGPKPSRAQRAAVAARRARGCNGPAARLDGRTPERSRARRRRTGGARADGGRGSCASAYARSRRRGALSRASCRERAFLRRAHGGARCGDGDLPLDFAWRREAVRRGLLAASARDRADPRFRATRCGPSMAATGRAASCITAASRRPRASPRTGAGC